MFKKIHLNEITVLFLLVLVLCGFIKKALYVFVILLVHEFGHIFVCLLFKIKILSIDIYPFGGILKLDKTINGLIYKDILLAVGGILFQFFLFLVDNNEFCLINKQILLFNLLPIIPLDGSKILFEILNLFISFKKSIKLYIYISLFFTILYLCYNVYFHIDNFLIIGLFISKTYEMFKNQKTIFNKFILERKLYNLPYLCIGKGVTKNNLKKQTKYYFYINGKIIDEKQYLSEFVC